MYILLPLNNNKCSSKLLYKSSEIFIYKKNGIKFVSGGMEGKWIYQHKMGRICI